MLRGINVGGKNIIPMQELRECLQESGFSNVRTYIQSGNVLFCSKSTSVKKITAELEKILSQRFDYDAKVFVCSSGEYKRMLQSANSSFGEHEDAKHNAMFIVGKLTPEEILDALPSLKKGIETVSTGARCLFWSVKKKQLGQSTMMKLAKQSIYRQLTVRNHKTTFRLSELLDQ